MGNECSLVEDIEKKVEEKEEKRKNKLAAAHAILSCELTKAQFEALSNEQTNGMPYIFYYCYKKKIGKYDPIMCDITLDRNEFQTAMLNSGTDFNVPSGQWIYALEDLPEYVDKQTRGFYLTRIRRIKEENKALEEENKALKRRIKELEWQ